MTQRLLFTGGLAAAQAEGRDIAAQTRDVMDRLGQALEAAGSDFAHVVTVHVHLARGEDFAAMNAVYQTFWKTEPPSRTTVVVGLPGHGTLIQVAAVAVPKGGQRRIVNPPGWADSPLPYSYAVRAGDTVFLAGLVARDRHTNKPVEGSVTSQLDRIMSNAREILGAAGLSLDHVASARVFLADGSAFSEMNAGWARQFAGPKPARATVIAGLMQSAYTIEVTLIAHAGQLQHLAADPPSENLSGAVRAGSMVFLSGMLAAGAGDAAAQTRATLAKARAALERAGAGPTDVADVTVWLPNMDAAAAIESAYRAFFPAAPPARVVMGAGLVAKEALVEIAMTAVRP